MNRIYLALYAASIWLMFKIQPAIEIEYSIQGTRYIHYHFDWHIEDGKLVAVLVADPESKGIE
jgi:hypothetical protein